MLRYLPFLISFMMPHGFNVDNASNKLGDELEELVRKGVV